MAKLYFHYGAMGAGKTTSLLQVAYNYEEKDMNVFLMKPASDTKGDHEIVSRLGVSRSVDFEFYEDNNLFLTIAQRFYKVCKGDLSCVLVDEAQFLTKEQVDQLLEVAIVLDIPVMCYGLKLDFRGYGFEGSTRLLEVAQTLTELKTICHCGRKADFNVRYINDIVVFDGEQQVIDDKDDVRYEAVCAKHFMDLKRGIRHGKRK